jgi:hypothetical protein
VSLASVSQRLAFYLKLSYNNVYWTIKEIWIQRAGRLTRPEGKLILTLGTNQAVQGRLLQFLARIFHELS